MCQYTHTWKNPACHEKTKAFQQRAFSILGGNDRIVWKFNMSGEFSASSTYRVLVNENQHDMAQSWSPTLWKRLWCLKLPCKMIIFLWKICNDYLMVRTTLHRRISQIPSICPICSKKDETLEHFFLLCPIARTHKNRAFGL